MKLRAKLRNIFKDVRWLILPSLLLSACGGNPLEVDVSDVSTRPVKVLRFEHDLFALQAPTAEQELEALQKKYPHFAEHYIRSLFCTAGLQDSTCIPEIIRFISDKDMRGVYELSEQKYADLSAFEQQLDGMMKHAKYYFPEKSQPEIYSMISGFNTTIANVDSGFGIGLDMYLGEDCKFYQMLQVPLYKKRTMRAEYMARDLALAWMMCEYPDPNKGRTLLGEMVYQGKLLYLVNALFPSMHDSLIIGFSGRQLDWCREYEKDIWGHLIQNKFLYSSENDIITKFTGEGPFTAGFVKESPARTGVWLGWNIVRAYMQEYPQCGLDELMKIDDAQIILAKSKYKP